MNTIQITTTDGTVNYTEAEVLRFIQRAKEADAVQESYTDIRKQIETNRYAVRDFFSECEWSDGETTITKSDVNELLDSIKTNRLTTKYGGTFTITGTFTVDCEDEDDAQTIFTDNVTVDFYDGDIQVDEVEVMDIGEEY